MKDFSRWILVAGTGTRFGLRDPLPLLAYTVGKKLAENGYGLIVGGWPGVDYLVASGFQHGLRLNDSSLALGDYLIQVIADGKYPDFKGGFIIQVPTGAREWLEAIKFADAVIMIGGEGGTRETYVYADQEQRPVFPIYCTGGDASNAYREILERWEVLPYQGFSRDDLIDTLGQRVENESDATELIDKLLSLLKAQFSYNLESANQLFVSYARKEKSWLLKLRSALRPLQKKATLSPWDDRDLQAGDDFLKKITKSINKSTIAVLLVSDAFLQSEFITKYEIPLIIKLHEEGKLRMYWLPVDGTNYKNSILSKYQSATDINIPLSSLPPARQHETLILVRKMIAENLR